jgi:uncharacterized damage-inducible protein DinB
MRCAALGYGGPQAVPGLTIIPEQGDTKLSVHGLNKGDWGMTLARYFRAQAYNNAWANHRLLTACGGLSDADLAAPRTNFFPSIIQTLNHTLTVDWYYIGALEGGGKGRLAFEPVVPFPAFVDLNREQRTSDARLIAFCEELSDARLEEIITIPRVGWVQTERVDRTLLHLFQHQIHHRGQVHAMLAGTAAAPPQLDEFFPADPSEVALRKDDFAALGFDEAAIWR